MASNGARILLIAGPTASGKSALAIKLAKAAGGEIVNADSMQVYADLPILTARPPASERGAISHHLFGHVDGAERYSVGRWLDDALAVIAEIQSRGRTPILVGGTGLYYRALTEGLAEAPVPGEAAKARAQELLQAGGLKALADEAHRLDPEAATKVDPNDRQRLLRIVEVALDGKPLSKRQNGTRPAIAPEGWRGVVLTPDREALIARIETRARSMLKCGAVEEVEALLARKLDPELPVMKALGVEAVADMIAGEASREETIETLSIETRQYAKRQRTWFCNQTPGWPRLDPLAPGAETALIEALTADLAANRR